jgi:Asp-tRNA(Asn)/Glu-tRNA(Gln) amidotransferase A subunit family amidase
VDLLLVPSLRDEILTITNFYQLHRPSVAHSSRRFCGSLEGAQRLGADPVHSLPKFAPPRRVPHGVTLIGRLFDEGTIGRAGLALERALNVAGQHPPGF